VIRLMIENFSGEMSERPWNRPMTHSRETFSLARWNRSHDSPHSELFVEKRGRKSCAR
jgi:hypothetical protein